MNEQRNAFLTDAIGKCWHEWEAKGEYVSASQCIKCGKYWPKYPLYDIDIETLQKAEAPAFSTWAGFGVLFEWAKQQEWWEEFVSDLCILGLNSVFGGAPAVMTDCFDFLDPDRFADAIYEFLKGDNDENNH